MGMNLAGPGDGNEPDVLVDINTTPLIDVMLVLLIMLIITIPMQLHAVDLDMPAGTPPRASEPPPSVRIDIAADGRVAWNGAALTGRAALEEKLSAAAAAAVQPELQLRPHRRSAYKVLAGVMAAAQRHGLNKIAIAGNETL